MPRKKRSNASDRQTRIGVGNISNFSGNLNIAGENITTHNTSSDLSVSEIRELFGQLNSNIEARPAISQADREDIKAEVQEILSAFTEAVQKNKKVDEGFLLHRFRNIARMAPDVLEVIVATLANPLAGLGVAVKKIAEKAKADAS